MFFHREAFLRHHRDNTIEQVHIDEAKGEMVFAPVAEVGTADESDVGRGESRDEGDELVQKAARYGCDPRNAWSPWR